MNIFDSLTGKVFFARTASQAMAIAGVNDISIMTPLRTAQAIAALTPSSITGNAATATKLASPVSIFGITFDGSGDVSGNAITDGHFASVPAGGEAGHFITLNGNAPSVVNGRSAWFSSFTGVPSFRNGTGSVTTLVQTGGAGGTPSSLTLTNATGLPLTTGVTGGLPIPNGGTGSTANTSTGAILYGNGSLARVNLLGNTSTTMAVLTQTGTGSASAAPVWTSTTGSGNIVRDTLPTINNPTASTSSSSTPALIVSGPTSNVDTLQIRGTTNASYSSIGLYDTTNIQRGSFGYGGSAAGSYVSTMFFNATGTVPMTFGTNITERARISAAGGFSIGTATDAGANNLLVAGSTKSNGGFIYGTFTVGTFPSTNYLEAIVTDALSPVVGSTVSAGGSNKCKVIFNGTNKIVTALL